MNETGQAVQNQDPALPEQRLLVAVSPSQISEPLVRWTHRLARALNCWWCMVYVETSRALSDEEQLQLSHAFSLARTLGAEVITTTDTDIVQGLLRTALQRDVTQIIVGKTDTTSFRSLFRSNRWMERLLNESGELDVHVVRLKGDSPAKVSSNRVPGTGSSLREYLIAVAMILAVTWSGQYAQALVGFRAIAWIYLTVVVVMAAFVGRGATLLAATLSALLWNFFFEPPIYSFSISDTEDQILFVMYLVIAVTLGQMVARIRTQEKSERERQERATALQLLTRELTETTDLDDIMQKAEKLTAGVFKSEVAFWLPSSSGPLTLHQASAFKIPEEEYQAAMWAFEHGQPAGRFTATSPSAATLFMPLAAHGDAAGVMGLRWSQPRAPTIHQRNLMDAFSQQIALVIQRHWMQEVEEKSKLLAESERLSKTLLNSISHEIRTPLAVIQSATFNMVELGHPQLSDLQKTMITEIQEASERLNRLVGKALDMTRLESGQIKPKFAPCEISELVLMAEGETRKELAHHTLTIEMAPDLPLVNMDFELILHAVTNLMSNAAFHTPAGTEVRLSVKAENGVMLLTVADRGPGMPPESLPHLFEKFYRAPNARTGGTGLGLSIVKGYVEAHDGEVAAENRATGGAAFTIRLPLEQAAADEAFGASA
jgi:two-component system, OmpR family, sensor histidine kinase KdpD